MAPADRLRAVQLDLHDRHHNLRSSRHGIEQLRRRADISALPRAAQSRSALCQRRCPANVDTLPPLSPTSLPASSLNHHSAKGPGHVTAQIDLVAAVFPFPSSLILFDRRARRSTRRYAGAPSQACNGSRSRRGCLLQQVVIAARLSACRQLCFHAIGPRESLHT